LLKIELKKGAFFQTHGNGQLYIYTVDSYYLEHLYFKQKFWTLGHSSSFVFLDLSNKFFGPLRVRDREFSVLFKTFLLHSRLQVPNLELFLTWLRIGKAGLFYLFFPFEFYF